MISFAEPLPIGNAVRVLLDPPGTAVKWRLLRKTTDDFSGQADANALVVYDGNSDKNIVDTATLTNGTPYFYREYDFDGTVWTAPASVSVTPATAYSFDGPDVLTVLRERLRSGLKAAVIAGTLNHATGAIPVYTAPPLEDEVKWPIVSVHLQRDSADGRGLGEMVVSDAFDSDAGLWGESEGWLSRYSLQIIGWSLNPDERITLRKVIKAVIQGNLSVFDAAGMVQIDFGQSDIEDFQSYNAPVYQTIGDFSCLAPAIVDAMAQDTVVDVTVDAETA